MNFQTYLTCFTGDFKWTFTLIWRGLWAIFNELSDLFDEVYGRYLTNIYTNLARFRAIFKQKQSKIGKNMLHQAASMTEGGNTTKFWQKKPNRCWQKKK